MGALSPLLLLVGVHVARFAESFGVIGHLRVFTVHCLPRVARYLMIAGPAVTLSVVVLLGMFALKFHDPPLPLGFFLLRSSFQLNEALSLFNSDQGFFAYFLLRDLEDVLS